VHELLAHVRRNGFDGAPQPFGFDERGREILAFIEGDVLATPQDPDGEVALAPWPAAWRGEPALTAAARLVRRLHDAAQGFRTEHAQWRLHDGAMRADEIICHGDAAPWNVVYRAGVPFALIDFDSARPDTPLLDLACSAWHFVPLADDETAAALGFDALDRPERLAAFAAAYGLADPRALPDALRAVKAREVTYPRFWGLAPEVAADHGARIDRQLAWLEALRPALERALA
jgi:hypothetical protein